MFSTQSAKLALALVASLTMTIAADALAQDASQDSSQDASNWAPAPKSRARLIASGGLEGGAYGAGVEIALSGRALTYWRNPGDAGVAPRFDFSGSRNLGSVEVIYPAPERHDEGGAEAFGWRKSVIFPVSVRPADPGAPVVLDLKLEYAACEEICVPSDAHLRFKLAPKASRGAQAGRIALWSARAPKQAPAKSFTITRNAAPLPAWIVTPVEPAGPDADLFAEGPEGWYFETRRIEGHFTLAAVNRPALADAQVEVRLTYRTASGATELQTRLDAAAAAP